MHKLGGENVPEKARGLACSKRSMCSGHSNPLRTSRRVTQSSCSMQASPPWPNNCFTPTRDMVSWKPPELGWCKVLSQGPLALKFSDQGRSLGVQVCSQGFFEPSETMLINFVQKCIFPGKEVLSFISFTEGSVILKNVRHHWLGVQPAWDTWGHMHSSESLRALPKRS